MTESTPRRDPLLHAQHWAAPQLSVEPLRESRLETLNDFASRMEKATDKACSALTRAADNMAQFYDTHRREAPLYKIRDKVWLNSQNIMTT